MAHFHRYFRGVDNEIEFRGLRGKYFYYAATSLVGAIFITMMLYVFGVPIIISLGFLVLIGGGGVYYFTEQNKKHGRWGEVKSSLKGLKPGGVINKVPINQLMIKASLRKLFK